AQEKKADAPKPAAALPTVDEILDKHVKAVGGKEAIEKVTSRVEKGTFEMPTFGVSGSIETYAKAPNKRAMFIDLGGVGKAENVFDGTKGWASNPQSGLHEQTGGELDATKRQADLHGDLKIKSHYTKMEVKGKEKVGDAEAYVIEATPSKGKPEKLYFDASSGLLVRLDIEVESEQGSLALQIFTEDYKPVDGVKVPHTIRQVSEAFSMTIKYTDVKQNVTVDDAKFNKPSGN
ncbi:MAG: hypothetical protein ACRD82_13020, partial [Blastocatellia bacterium]